MGLKLREDRMAGRPVVSAEMRFATAGVNRGFASGVQKSCCIEKGVEATSGIEPEYTDLQSAA